MASKNVTTLALSVLPMLDHCVGSVAIDKRAEAISKIN